MRSNRNENKIISKILNLYTLADTKPVFYLNVYFTEIINSGTSSICYIQVFLKIKNLVDLNKNNFVVINLAFSYVV